MKINYNSDRVVIPIGLRWITGAGWKKQYEVDCGRSTWGNFSKSKVTGSEHEGHNYKEKVERFLRKFWVHESFRTLRGLSAVVVNTLLLKRSRTCIYPELKTLKWDILNPDIHHFKVPSSGTTQILLTNKVNTRIQSCNYQCQIKGHDPQSVYQNKEPQEYNPWSINATWPLPLDATLLAVDINRKLVTIHPKLKGKIPNLFKRTGNHMNTIRDLSTPHPLGAISVAN